MGVSAGSGVSIGGGSGAVDLEAIIAGGDAFTARLKLFDEAATRARDNAARAEALLAEAKQTEARAFETQAQAEALIASCVVKAQELDAAIAAAKAARAELDGRLEPLLKFLRK